MRDRALGYLYVDPLGGVREADADATLDAVASRKAWDAVGVVADLDGTCLDAALDRMAAGEAEVLVVVDGLPHGRRGDKSMYDRARREGWRFFLLHLGVEQGGPLWDRLEELWTAGRAAAPLARVPMPPPRLRRRVSGNTDASAFEGQAAVFLRDAAAALRRQGADVGAARSVLDFGCGPGRLLRHLVGLLPDAEMTGVDVDPEPIAWLAANLSRARAATVPELPPTELPPDAYDLVIAFSVFTHLDARRQDAWLAELARVTAPGGHALVTVHGDTFVELVRQHPLSEIPAAAAAELTSAGMGYWPGASDELPDWYGVAVHTSAYVRDHWSRWFDVLDVVPGGAQVTHDLVVMRRPARGAR